MDDLRTTTDAIRRLLFRRADLLTQHLLKRMADVASHIRSDDYRAVIGALDGLESDIQTIRTLMALMDDCF